MADNTRQDTIDRLARDLEKATAAGEFVNSNGGKLLMNFISADINRFVAQISSDKFVNDHNGYLDARSKLSYASSLLKRLTRLSDPDVPQAIREQINLAQSEAEPDGQQ